MSGKKERYSLGERLASVLRLAGNLKNPLQTLWRLKVIPSRLVLVQDKDSGVKMLTARDAFQVLSESWYNKDYEVTEVPIRPGDIVVDIGANHGFFSCLASSKMAKVWAVEPSTANFELLKRNVQLNGFDNRVVCIKTAIGAEPGESRLYHLPRYAGAMNATHEVYADRNSNGQLSSLSFEMVEVRTIEQLISEVGEQRIRMLKMDCEGAEFEILASLSPLSAEAIDCIVIEYHHVYELNDIYSLAKDLGCFEVSLANQLPWAARQIIRLVNKRVWQSIPNFDYDKH